MRTAILTLIAIAAAASGEGVRPAPAGAQLLPPPGTMSYTYALVDTWESEPWVVRPGHVYSALDVTSTSDGRVFVLDGRPNGRYVHVFDDDFTATAVFGLSDDAYQDRIDASPAGTLLTVGKSRRYYRAPEGLARWHVEEYSPSGDRMAIHDLDIVDTGVAGDVGAGPEGRTYVTVVDTQRNEDVVPSVVVVLDGAGALSDTIEAADYYGTDHGTDPHYVLDFERVDVAPNGDVTVAVDFPRCY